MLKTSQLQGALPPDQGLCELSESFQRVYGERGARAYNGGLEAEPSAGSRGRAPGHGVRGEAL